MQNAYQKKHLTYLSSMEKMGRNFNINFQNHHATLYGLAVQASTVNPNNSSYQKTSNPTDERMDNNTEQKSQDT